MQYICLGNKSTKVLFKLIAFTEHSIFSQSNIMKLYEVKFTETATE